MCMWQLTSGILPTYTEVFFSIAGGGGAVGAAPLGGGGMAMIEPLGPGGSSNVGGRNGAYTPGWGG